MSNRQNIYNAIEEEITRGQRDKSFSHTDGVWLAILIDYLGRATRRIYAGKGVDKVMLIKVLAAGVSWLHFDVSNAPERPRKPLQG